jgi:signal transduction histidine kinase
VSWKFLLSVFFTGILYFNTWAAGLPQQPLTDTGSISDREQIIHLLDSVRGLEKEQPELLIETGRRMSVVSASGHFREGIAVSSHVMGCGYAGISRFDLAMDHYLNALEIFEELDDTCRKASVFISLSQLYSGIKDQNKALEYCSKALDLFRSAGDNLGQAIAWNLMGTLYMTADPSKACDYFIRTLNFREEMKDSIGIASCYNNLGICYQNSFEYDNALGFYQQAFDLYERFSEKLFMIVVMNNMGNVFGLTGNNRKRLEILKKSLELTREISNSRAEINVLNNLAHYYYSTGDHENSIEYLKLSLAKAMECKAMEFIPSIYEYLSEVYQAKENYHKALIYHQEFVRIKDSLYNESRDKIFDMQIAYITERENKEKEMLRLQNQMKDLEVSRQTRLKMFFGILLLLSALTVIVIYRSYRIKKRTSSILSKQKAQLEELNRILSESENRLKDLNLTKDKFFSIMAHDLKNPLGSMVSLADMINHNFNRIPAADLETFLQNLHLSVKTVYSLLENLLIWSRSQTGRLEYSPEVFDLNPVVEDCLQIFLFQAKEQNIRLLNSVNVTHRVYADKNMIFTVIRNLVTNGIKFSLSGGMVAITSVSDGELVKVAVTDQGIGMTGEDMQKLFRIDVANTTIGTFRNGQREYAARKGTGLGLILCREFVEKCKGKIRVESELGKGSSFIFELPANNTVAG